MEAMIQKPGRNELPAWGFLGGELHRRLYQGPKPCLRVHPFLHKTQEALPEPLKAAALLRKILLYLQKYGKQRRIPRKAGDLLCFSLYFLV